MKIKDWLLAIFEVTGHPAVWTAYKEFDNIEKASRRQKKNSNDNKKLNLGSMGATLTNGVSKVKNTVARAGNKDKGARGISSGN